MKALVLSGGGGKGAYQIGAWKAFRKLKIKFDIITGTSVGALNGAIMTQNSYYRAVYMWKKVCFNLIFDEDIKENIDTFEGKKEVFKMYGKNIIQNQGMKVDKLEQLLRKVLEPRKILQSKIKFGFITVKLNNFQPQLITTDNVEEDKLIDYLMASATCFPAFKLKKIDDENYLDGGYYDNTPINLAIGMGATEVIVVDLDAIGLSKKVENKDIPITYIEPINPLSNILIFDKKNNNQNMCYGYNDVMKKFGELEGKNYTFEKDELAYNYHKFKDDFKRNVNHFLISDSKNDYAAEDIINPKKVNETIEYLGEIFQIPNYKIYNMYFFNYLLKSKLKKYDDEKLNSSTLITKALKIFDKKFIVKRIYLALLAGNIDEINNSLLLFSKETLAALYLYTIGRKNYEK